MIGFIQGEIVFSDGVELILLTKSGVGYQVYFNRILPEGALTSIYTSQIFRENSQDLYGFSSFNEKKIFEMLTSVKGVGPKSAFRLIGTLGAKEVVNAIVMESKKTLTKAPGIGPKAAAQMILDLGTKIQKSQIYADSKLVYNKLDRDADLEKGMISISENTLIDDTLMACKELGFKEDDVLELAKKLLETQDIKKPEQLIHLVLKEI